MDEEFHAQDMKAYLFHALVVEIKADAVALNERISQLASKMEKAGLDPQEIGIEPIQIRYASAYEEWLYRIAFVVGVEGREGKIKQLDAVLLQYSDLPTLYYQLTANLSTPLTEAFYADLKKQV